MITPKEKALELKNKFQPHSKYWDCYNDEPLEENHDIESALICVDEIYFGIYNYLKDTDELQNADTEFAYWENVKEELKKIYE
jgi:hypothetical protein